MPVAGESPAATQGKAASTDSMTIDTSKTIAAAGSGEATASCWSCGDMRAAHFCHACGKVQPPLPVDYFSFFGLPRKLNLDVAASGKRVLRAEPETTSRPQCPRRQTRAGMEPGAKLAAQRRLPHVERIQSSARNICCDWRAWNSKSSRRPRPRKRAPAAK